VLLFLLLGKMQEQQRLVQQQEEFGQTSSCENSQQGNVL